MCILLSTIKRKHIAYLWIVTFPSRKYKLLPFHINKQPVISQHTSYLRRWGKCWSLQKCHEKCMWADTLDQKNSHCKPSMFTCLLQTDEGCDPSQPWFKSCIGTSVQYHFLLKQVWLKYQTEHTQLLPQNWPDFCEHRAQAGRTHIYLQRNRKILFCLGEAKRHYCLHTRARERNQLSNRGLAVEDQLQWNRISIGWKLGECLCHHSNEILEQLPNRNTMLITPFKMKFDSHLESVIEYGWVDRHNTPGDSSVFFKTEAEITMEPWYNTPDWNRLCCWNPWIQIQVWNMRLKFSFGAGNCWNTFLRYLTFLI